MAEKKARKLRPEDVGALPQEQIGEVEKFAKALLDNWKQIAGGVALVVVCLLAYALFQLKQNEDNLQANSLYVKAFMEPGDEDEGSEKKLALLEEASSKGTKLQLEMLYVYGEECIRAEKFDKAKEIMTRISTEYADSVFAGRAADALAFLKENDGDFEGAIKDYEAIKSKFPGTLEALRIPGKVAKLQEKLGNFEMAVKLYKEQLELFPESGAAENAQTALDRLKIKYPQFFPEDEELKELAALEAPIEAPADAISVDEGAAPGEETAVPATEEVAPAVEVPADAAPMEDAPAADAPAEAAETPAPTEAAPAEAAEAPAETTEAPAVQ